MPLWPRTPTAIGEAYQVEGVDCQCGHVLIAGVEEDVARALERADTDDLLQKKLLGLLEGRPLHGAALIERWQARLSAYPEALAVAMVRRHLSELTPSWYLQEYLPLRDAVIWERQLLVEAAQHLLGILAGLNRVYYSTFQFKGLRHLTAQIELAPDRLAERLESLIRLEWRAAVGELEALVGETLPLIERELPVVDTGAARQRLGTRKQPAPGLMD
jgi:hypothetical protein